jgi:hypothetical protein
MINYGIQEIGVQRDIIQRWEGNMEVCKNKDSGKYFLYLQDCGPGGILLVTPEAQVKPLRVNLFDEVEDFSEEYLIENALVSPDQVRKFNEYQQDRSNDLIEGFIIDFENMTQYQQRVVFRKLQEKAENMEQ